jgi:hypothetical protein
MWAPDALFELLRVGVDSVNIHVRADAINAAILPAAHGLVIRPLLYGLVLFARTLGPGAELASLHLSQARLLHLKAWAVRVAAGLNVLLVNKGVHPASVALPIPGFSSARVQRLLGLSPAATSGETLAGQTLGPDGLWRGKRHETSLPAGPAGFEVSVPAASAALVQLR